VIGRRPGALTIAVALLVVAGCSGSDSVNPHLQGGLAEATQLEIAAVAAGGDGERWVTVNDADTAAAVAATLDDIFPLEEPSCDPEYRLRFFLSGGGEVEFGYGCPAAARLGGDQDYWQGQQMTAPEAFSEMVNGLIARLDF